jgi:hypothetical protein
MSYQLMSIKATAARLRACLRVVATRAAAMNPTDLVLSRLRGKRRSGGGWIACCPAHEDRSPSLSICEGRDGRVLIYCHAGYPTTAVLAALGLQMRDLFVQRGRGI